MPLRVRCQVQEMLQPELNDGLQRRGRIGRLDVSLRPSKRQAAYLTLLKAADNRHLSG